MISQDEFYSNANKVKIAELEERLASRDHTIKAYKEYTEKLEMRLLQYDRALKKAIEMVVFEKPVNMSIDPLVTAVQLREELLGDE